MVPFISTDDAEHLMDISNSNYGDSTGATTTPTSPAHRTEREEADKPETIHVLPKSSNQMIETWIWGPQQGRYKLCVHCVIKEYQSLVFL